MHHIPFNKPYLTGKEAHYLYKSVLSGKISGNGLYTKRCQKFFEEKYGFKKTLLTTSCTDALEMAAILLNVSHGDEIIMPSFTFVSTANAFKLRGAKIIFIDSQRENPNIDTSKIREAITDRTKAIVPVHYAGVACDMDEIMKIADEFNIYVVEDSAQGIDSYYKNKALGSIGHLGAFSFHETKNITSGEGGLLIINDDQFIKRAEIIWEKGTNRSAFFRGEIDKYNWVDIGSSFLPSDINAAFLWAQLETLNEIQSKRKKLWALYFENLKPITDKIELPKIPDFATNNAHMFYILCNSLSERSNLISFLKKNDILSVFHYLPLHKAPFLENEYQTTILENCEKFSNHILRLPLYYELEKNDILLITSLITAFYKNNESSVND